MLKLTFPHMGNLWIIAQTLFESVNIDVVVPPENSMRTLTLGTKYSAKGISRKVVLFTHRLPVNSV